MVAARSRIGALPGQFLRSDETKGPFLGETVRSVPAVPLAATLPEPHSGHTPGPKVQPGEGGVDGIDVERDPQRQLLLIQSALRGDEVARSQVAGLLTRLPALMREKHRRMGLPLSTHEMEDATQNALCAIWRKLDRFDGRGCLQAWAYGFGVLEILKAVEQKSRRRRPLELSPDIEPSFETPNSERVEAVARALAQLPASDRGIVERKHFEGSTFESIGTALRCSTNTIKSRYYRALGRMKQAMRSEGDR